MGIPGHREDNCESHCDGRCGGHCDGRLIRGSFNLSNLLLKGVIEKRTQGTLRGH